MLRSTKTSYKNEKKKYKIQTKQQQQNIKIEDRVIDELLHNYKTPADLLGKNGLLRNLQKRLIERAMAAELTHELGYQKHGKDQHLSSTQSETYPKQSNPRNYRNGTSAKTVRSNSGKIKLEVPRDRNGDFEPKIIPKHQRHFDGFDDAILSLYAKGLSTRDICDHLEEIYGVEISPALVSSVTDELKGELADWQNRQLDKVYPIIYFDALVAKARKDGQIINHSIYVALAVNLEGKKEVLGLWHAENEGAKFWLGILTELKNRGLEHPCICCVDRLSGFAEAIQTLFPKAKVQLCIVHMIRNSLKYVSHKNRKEICADLKTIYSAKTEKNAAQNLQKFAQKWDSKYPAVSRSWQQNWAHICPFFDYPPDIRRVIYTTNAIESLNSSLRKVSKHRKSFPSTDALIKLFYLALKQASKKWSMPIQNWIPALNRFILDFPEINDKIK